MGGGLKSSPEFYSKLYSPAISSSLSPIVKTATKVTTPLTKSGGVLFPLVSATQLIETNYPSYVGGTSIKYEVSTKEQLSTRVKTFEAFSSGLDTSQGLRLKNIPLLASPSGLTQRGATSIIQIPSQIQIPKQIERPRQTPKQITTSPRSPGFPTPIIPTKIKFPLPEFKFVFGFGDEQGRGKKIRAVRISRYVPSYTALVFNIQGKEPKGVETGLRLRPITKGFSFANLFSPKRVRIQKIRRKK